MTELEKVITGLECCRMNGKGCTQCPYNKECDEMPDFGNAYLCSDAMELLKEQRETIASLQGTICKLNAALAEQPEQKHGYWIEYPKCLEYDGALDDTYIVCSACEHVFNVIDNCTELFDYCPKCGAKMDEEVKQDENIS